ncbi:hypothetical protein [Hyphobacterium sp.]|uniref:hypothetical protein n=1 Tax=Hyphobacterium sp. TaxID=2004662 RepID=UPI003B527572
MAIGLLAIMPAAFAQDMQIEFDPGRFASDDAARAYIEASAMGSAIEIHALDITAGTAQLEGAPAHLIRSNPAYLRVIENAPAGRARVHEIHLGGSAVFASRGAPAVFHPGRRTGWPGEQLRVVAYGADGREIAETFAPDPRFVRHEGWSGTGDHITGSNRSHIQDAPLPPLSVSLPEDTAQIAVFDRAGSRHAPEAGRRIGLIEAHQIVEAGQ